MTNLEIILFLGSKILGDDDVTKNFSPYRIEFVNGVEVLHYQNLRWEVTKSFETKDIHPSAQIYADGKLSHGVQIMAWVVLQPGSKVRGNSIINLGVLLDHDCDVDLNCHLSLGVASSGVKI